MSTGSSSASLSASHLARAAAWHFGQLRLVHELYMGDAMFAVALFSLWPPRTAVRQSRNILERFSLLARQHLSPSRPKIVFVYAENIGQFEPMFTHRSAEMWWQPELRRAGPGAPMDWWSSAPQYR